MCNITTAERDELLLPATLSYSPALFTFGHFRFSLLFLLILYSLLAILLVRFVFKLFTPRLLIEATFCILFCSLTTL